MTLAIALLGTYGWNLSPTTTGRHNAVGMDYSSFEVQLEPIPTQASILWKAPQEALNEDSLEECCSKGIWAHTRGWTLQGLADAVTDVGKATFVSCMGISHPERSLNTKYLGFFVHPST